MVAGVAGIPTVAAIVAGAGLAGRLQAAQPVTQQLPAGAIADHLLQGDADQMRGDGVAFLRRRRRLVVALEQLAIGVQHATHRMQWLDLAARGQELVKLGHGIGALVGRAQDQCGIRFGLDPGQHAHQFGQALGIHLHADTHGGLVVGMRQCIDQPHRAMAAVVGIARAPAPVLAQLHGDR